MLQLCRPVVRSPSIAQQGIRPSGIIPFKRRHRIAAVVDAQVVAGALVQVVEDAVQLDERLGIVRLQRKWEVRDGLTHAEGVEFATGPLARPTDQNAVVAAVAVPPHTHRFPGAQQVDLDQVGQRAEDGQSFLLVLPASFAGALVCGREDLQHCDDFVAADLANLQIGLAHVIGDRQFDPHGPGHRLDRP